MGCPCDVAKSVAESKSFHLEFCWLETPHKRQRLVRTYDVEGLAVSSTYFSETKLWILSLYFAFINNLSFLFSIEKAHTVLFSRWGVYVDGFAWVMLHALLSLTKSQRDWSNQILFSRPKTPLSGCWHLSSPFTIIIFQNTPPSTNATFVQLFFLFLLYILTLDNDLRWKCRDIRS